MLLILLIKLCGLKKILIFRYIVVLVFAPVNEFRRDEFPQWIILLARNTQSPWCEHQRSIQTHSFRVLLLTGRHENRPDSPKASQFLMRLGDFKQGSDSALPPQRWEAMHKIWDELIFFYLPLSSVGTSRHIHCSIFTSLT